MLPLRVPLPTPGLRGPSGGVPSPPWNGHCLEEGLIRPVPWVPLYGGAEHTSALSAIYHGVVIN